jgi:hypothetical protein
MLSAIKIPEWDRDVVVDLYDRVRRIVPAGSSERFASIDRPENSSISILVNRIVVSLCESADFSHYSKRLKTRFWHKILGNCHSCYWSTQSISSVSEPKQLNSFYLRRSCGLRSVSFPTTLSRSNRLGISPVPQATAGPYGQKALSRDPAWRAGSRPRQDAPAGVHRRGHEGPSSAITKVTCLRVNIDQRYRKSIMESAVRPPRRGRYA